MTNVLNSVADVIDAWPCIADFAADACCGYEAARQMRRRGSIPPGYWVRIVQAAEARGLQGVTYQRLAELSAFPAESLEAAE